MKPKRIDQYLGKRVKRKGDAHNTEIGYIAERATTSGWWIVQWPDGKRSPSALRHLVIVDEDTDRH